MKILEHPHAMLRQPCSPVTVVNEEIRQQIAEMLDLMYLRRAVGLSANQVGLPHSMLVMNVTGKRAHPEEEFVFFNPVITHRFGGMDAADEMCLSIPGRSGLVTRSKKVKFVATSRGGLHMERTFKGYRARVLQHECDHLRGKLFTDYLKE